jgi:hypothetical protein
MLSAVLAASFCPGWGSAVSDKETRSKKCLSLDVSITIFKKVLFQVTHHQRGAAGKRLIDPLLPLAGTAAIGVTADAMPGGGGGGRETFLTGQ